jgi:homoserine O-acetyltransferase
MHSWVWGETYPDFMDALMPLACLPVQIQAAIACGEKW